MADQRTIMSFAKQNEVVSGTKREKPKNLYAIAAAISLFLLAYLAFGFISTKAFIRNKAIIEKERDRSDHLLPHFLPRKCSEKRNMVTVKAKKHDAVTVCLPTLMSFTIDFGKALTLKAWSETVASENFSKLMHCRKHGLEQNKRLSAMPICVLVSTHGSEENHSTEDGLGALDNET